MSYYCVLSISADAKREKVLKLRNWLVWLPKYRIYIYKIFASYINIIRSTQKHFFQNCLRSVSLFDSWWIYNWWIERPQGRSGEYKYVQNHSITSNLVMLIQCDKSYKKITLYIIQSDGIFASHFKHTMKIQQCTSMCTWPIYTMKYQRLTSLFQIWDPLPELSLPPCR